MPYIPFNEEQKHRAATVSQREYLPHHGEALIPSGPPGFLGEVETRVGGTQAPHPGRRTADSRKPLGGVLQPRDTVKGRELRPSSRNGTSWTPMFLRQEYEQGEYNWQVWETIWLMDHCDLDAEKG